MVDVSYTRARHLGHSYVGIRTIYFSIDVNSREAARFPVRLWYIAETGKHYRLEQILEDKLWFR